MKAFSEHDVKLIIKKPTLKKIPKKIIENVKHVVDYTDLFVQLYQHKETKAEDIIDAVEEVAPLIENVEQYVEQYITDSMLVGEELTEFTDEDVKKYILNLNTPSTKKVVNVVEQLEENINEKTVEDLKKKVNNLEQWISRVAAHGPGSGEVKLRRLDDVDSTTIADGRTLQYNSTSKKFEFTRPVTSAYHVTRVHETVQLLDHSVPQIITDMTLCPPAGTYIVNYNSKFAVIDTSSITSAAKAEVTSLYADLSTRSATGSETSRTASDIYANETLDPGVYIHTGAVTINGKLTLDAGGDPAAEFIIRTAGAITTGTFAEIELIGDATSSNVWFVAAGAPSTGANTIFRGNMIADQAAPSLGATTSFEGRMLAVNGAIAIGEACTITAPTGTGTTSIGSLVVFSLFTGNQAVSNTGTVTTVALSIGTDNGAITGFADGNVGGNLYPGGAGQSSRLRIGVYLDGVLVEDSRRQYDHAFQNIDEEYQIVLQSVVTITDEQCIDIRASAAFGKVAVGPRMSLVLTNIN